MTIVRRPFGVTLIAVFMLLVGIARTLFGALLLFRNPYIEADVEGALPEASASADFTLITGIVFLVIGLLGLLMSYGMFSLKGWAWTWTTVVASLNLVGAIVGYFANQRIGLDAWLSTILFALVIYYLSTTPVKRAFGFGQPG